MQNVIISRGSQSTDSGIGEIAGSLGGLVNVLKRARYMLARVMEDGTASLADENKKIADSAKAAAAGEKALAAGTRAAYTAAKRAVAGFDQLNRLQFAAGRSSGSSRKNQQTEAEDTGTEELERTIAMLDQVQEEIIRAQQTTREVTHTVADLWAEAGQWINDNVILPSAAFFSSLWQGIAEGGTECWQGLRALIELADTCYKDVIGMVWQSVKDLFQGLGTAANDCWQGLLRLWSALWSCAGDVIAGIGQAAGDLFRALTGAAENCLNGIAGLWNTVALWFGDNVIRPMEAAFSGLWERLISGAGTAWEGMKTVFRDVAGFFGDIFSRAWAKVISVFSASGEIFTQIRDGVLTAFKRIVNGLISGLNSVVAVPFNGINNALSSLRKINILGLTPFTGLKSVSVPQIPYLAQGAVLPANKPFMAVVGDQRRGTNVEAPLTTIQEAVAEVMRQQQDAMMAGFNATVENQKKLLEAVLGIRIGDQVIGRAAEGYRACRARMVGEPW